MSLDGPFIPIATQSLPTDAVTVELSVIEPAFVLTFTFNLSVAATSPV